MNVDGVIASPPLTSFPSKYACELRTGARGRGALPEAAQSGRAGGVYVPPHKLRQMQSEMAKDPLNKDWQRMQFEALRKSINGLVNKVCFVLFQLKRVTGPCGVRLWLNSDL
jgi:hypothetical protein